MSDSTHTTQLMKPVKPLDSTFMSMIRIDESSTEQTMPDTLSLQPNSTLDLSIVVAVVRKYLFRHIKTEFIDFKDVPVSQVQDRILQWMSEYGSKYNCKIVGCNFDSFFVQPIFGGRKLCERAWLELDVVSGVVPINDQAINFNGEGMRHEIVETLVKQQLVQLIYDYFEVPGENFEDLNDSCVGEVSHNGFDIAKVRMDATRRVIPQRLTTLDAYRDPRQISVRDMEFDRLLVEAERFKRLGNRIVFLSSTGQGGGVALMRHALIRLMNLLECSVSWHVLLVRHEIFKITKLKFHNILQGVAPRDLVLTENDKELMNMWSEENVDLLYPVLMEAKVIVCDDYQPSGLIPFIRRHNPHAKIIYRSHIHIDSHLVHQKSSPQSVTWDFIWNQNQVKHVDVFLSHPIKEFVPDMVPRHKVVLMPATTDPLDGLNKPLSENQIDYYCLLFNNFLISRYQTPLDLKRPYIIQTARFDPSKGIPDVLESYRRLRHRLPKDFPLEKTPQLVIVGHGSIDDPESEPIMETIESLLSLDIYSPWADDIKRARIPHNDQTLNALLRKSHVALQLSHREGLEVKITECLFKGKPVILNDVGGMPLQAMPGQNSFVVPLGQTHKVEELLYELFMNEEKLKQMSECAAKTAQSQFFTVSNCVNWLFLANELVEKGKITSDVTNIRDLIYFKPSTDSIS